MQNERRILLCWQKKMYISEALTSIYRLLVKMMKSVWNMKPEKRLFGIITRLYWKQSSGEKLEERLEEKLEERLEEKLEEKQEEKLEEER